MKEEINQKTRIFRNDLCVPIFFKIGDEFKLKHWANIFTIESIKDGLIYTSDGATLHPLDICEDIEYYLNKGV